MKREPVTQYDIVDGLRGLGVRSGDVVLVHASMRSMGFVVGGAQTVVEALLETVGPGGTLVVPTHSPAWSEPSHWMGDDTPESWVDRVRDNTPAFHPGRTPTIGMGAVSECVRHWPGFRRSWHPRASFGALGPRAEEVLADHALTSGLGEQSPLAKLYDLDASVVLVGVGHECSSVLHLSEHRAAWPAKRWLDQGAAVLVDGERQWVAWRELDDDSSDFPEIGAALAAAGAETFGHVGHAECRRFRVRDAVDTGVSWIEVHRETPPVARTALAG